MLTDALSAGGMNIPKLSAEHQDKLIGMMNAGASAAIRN